MTKRTNWPALLLLALGLGMMALGYQNGELRVYFINSINLCLECVGIG